MPLILIAIAVGIIALTVRGQKGSMKARYQRKRRLRQWRKRHGMPRETTAEGPPPMPMHIATKIGDRGDPRTGISTQDTDNFLAAVRRLFASKRKRTRRE
ncbi:MAG TPA: hypothetical protein VMU41_02680 [Candidatus Binataceae bacterium]|nr:hypothetical protein [Candidatus Binataceae bacterium]